MLLFWMSCQNYSNIITPHDLVFNGMLTDEWHKEKSLLVYFEWKNGTRISAFIKMVYPSRRARIRLCRYGVLCRKTEFIFQCKITENLINLFAVLYTNQKSTLLDTSSRKILNLPMERRWSFKWTFFFFLEDVLVYGRSNWKFCSSHQLRMKMCGAKNEVQGSYQEASWNLSFFSHN